MMANLSGWHFLIILAVLLFLFGATKLPALARSLGQSAKIFKNEVKERDRGVASENRVAAADEVFSGTRVSDEPHLSELR